MRFPTRHSIRAILAGAGAIILAAAATPASAAWGHAYHGSFGGGWHGGFARGFSHAGYGGWHGGWGGGWHGAGYRWHGGYGWRPGWGWRSAWYPGWGGAIGWSGYGYGYPARVITYAPPAYVVTAPQVILEHRPYYHHVYHRYVHERCGCR